MANQVNYDQFNSNKATGPISSALVPSISPDDPMDFVHPIARSDSESLSANTSSDKSNLTNPLVSNKTPTKRSKKATNAKKKVNKTKKKEHIPKPKFSFRRNIIPPFIGFVFMFSVFGLLNSEWVVAEYTLKFSKPVMASMPNPNQTIASDASEVLIPTINTKVPLLHESSTDDKYVQKQLQSGVVHYGNLGEFGKNGNVIIIGHSSGALWTPGSYKYVFTFLDKLKQGDKIMVDYLGQRYIYNVTSSKIVEPTSTDVLKQPNDKKLITLITCSPVGSNQKRLIVTGEQISPKSSVPTTLQQDQTNAVNKTSAPLNTLPGAASKSPIEMIKSIYNRD